MTRDDAERICKAVASTLSIYNREPTRDQFVLWVKALSRFSPAEVERGLSAHVSDPDAGRFPPTPAHVIAQLERLTPSDGHPGPEEAWAIAVQSADERDTVVWTHEIAQAWFSAKPVFDLGDEVGARMAFREAYARLLAESRRNNAKAMWEVSAGFDPERRRVAVQRAVSMGFLPAAKMAELAAPQSCALLESGAATDSAEAKEARKQLRALMELLRGPVETGPSHAEIERQKVAERKREIEQRVNDYQSREGA